MKKIILFTLLAVLASACLEYKEKTKINDDGSGEIKFAIGISESLFNMNNSSGDIKEFDETKLRHKYSNAKGIKFIGSRSYSEAGNRWIEINLSFDSVEELMEASKDTSNLGMIGDIKLYEDSKGNMIFERRISSSKNGIESDSTNKGNGDDVVSAMFNNYKWTYELTLPGRIISANAQTVDEKANTIRWYFSLGSLSHASSMVVTYAKPTSINITLLILLVMVAIVLALVLLYLLKLKKDEEVHVK
jgi:hypothetical protein